MVVGSVLDVWRGRRYENFFWIPVPIIPWVGPVTAAINARWHDEKGLYLSSQRNLILNNIIYRNTLNRCVFSLSFIFQRIFISGFI